MTGGTWKGGPRSRAEMRSEVEFYREIEDPEQFDAAHFHALAMDEEAFGYVLEGMQSAWAPESLAGRKPLDSVAAGQTVVVSPAAQDDIFSRGLVLATKDDLANVLYTDFGKTDKVKRSQLYAPVGEDVKHPSLAVSVVVPGVKKEMAALILSNLTETSLFKARLDQKTMSQDGER